MTRHYRAYGLTLASEVELPELDEVTAQLEPDLHIVKMPVPGPVPEGRGERLCEIGPDGAYFAWESLARIRIDDWSRVAVEPGQGVSDAALAFALLGPVIATILHGRGDLILHGSAVEIADGRAVLFVGDNSAGKSTLAGAFIRAGHALVNDDVAAICTRQSGSPQIRRGFPAMKLSQPALAALDPVPGTLLPSPIANPAKHRLRVPGAGQAPLQLAHIFLVERGGTANISPLGPGERLGLAMRYSYMPKLGPAALPPLRAPAHFRQCAAVADVTPTSLLHVPDRLEALPDTVARIAAYLETAARPARETRSA
jgi:hypothetical protein